MTTILRRHYRFLICLLMFLNLSMATTFFSPGGSPIDSLWILSASALYVSVTLLLCLFGFDDSPDAADTMNSPDMAGDKVDSPFTISALTNEQPHCPNCEIQQQRINALLQNSRNLEKWNQSLRTELNRMADDLGADWWKHGKDSPI